MSGYFAEDQSYVVFQVADNGSGVPAEIRSRLFERYMTTKGQKGTGLGIAPRRDEFVAEQQLQHFLVLDTR